MGSGVSQKIRTTKERFFIVFRETMYIMLENLRVEATYMFYVPSAVVGEDGPDNLFAQGKVGGDVKEHGRRCWYVPA